MDLLIETEHNGTPNGSIEIGRIDQSGDVQMECINQHGDVVYKFINKEQAKQIIEHLQKEFKL